MYIRLFRTPREAIELIQALESCVGRLPEGTPVLERYRLTDLVKDLKNAISPEVQAR